jgi:P4 family phage/plasmid primase-like protien
MIIGSNSPPDKGGSAAASNGTGKRPQVPAEVKRFLAAIFKQGDRVGIRPIETWTDAATRKKCSRVDYRHICYCSARELATDGEGWNNMQANAKVEKTNIFFTVAPRVGPDEKKGAARFDLAWQIRVLRVVWADLDNCTVEEALKRCEAAGLPRPSVIVRSGHGVHLYWILSEEYRIDDAGDPPAVYTEFIDRGSDKKKATRKIVETESGGCVHLYLPDRKKGGDSGVMNPECPWGEPSPKALHFQDVLAGVAAKIGGDHTKDISRLLRLPGTMNRKDQRSGKEPIPCEIIEWDPERKYPFADFERFADSPVRRRREAVAKMRLPSVRKLTAKRKDTFDGLVNACEAASVGDRSECDWRLICWAIEHGVGREEVWDNVQSIGKFAEKGREYFDRTWGKAEGHTREKIYDKAQRAANGKLRREESPPAGASASVPPGQDSAEGAEEDAGDFQESATDPHRLGRVWLARCATHVTRGDAAAYYRNQYWRWRKNRWYVVPDNELKAELNRFIRRDLEILASQSEEDEELPAVTRELVSNVAAAVESATVVSQEIPQPCWRGTRTPERRNWIALENGILDVDALLAGADEVLLPHSPKWFSPSCLPYAFDPNADCPLWKKFLGRNLGDDPGKQRLLRQWCGYLLLHDTTQQRFLAMVGEGSNGKSVACEVITALLGEDNVSTEPLELFGDKFRLVNTLGKLANITAEVGELDKMAEGYLKAFVVGDPMTFEQKFKPAFTARLMLATNNIPRFNDKSDGIWRRLILLPFVVQIPKGEAVKGMDKREWWRERGELPGIFNWALAGLADLKKEGQVSIPQSCQAAADEIRLKCNPARLFLKENYQPGSGHVFKQSIYQRYSEWCKERNYKPLADRGFGKEVKREFHSVRDGKQRRNPKLPTSTRENCYEGLTEKSCDHEEEG